MHRAIDLLWAGGGALLQAAATSVKLSSTRRTYHVIHADNVLYRRLCSRQTTNALLFQRPPCLAASSRHAPGTWCCLLSAAARGWTPQWPGVTCGPNGIQPGVSVRIVIMPTVISSTCRQYHCSDITCSLDMYHTSHTYQPYPQQIRYAILMRHVLTLNKNCPAYLKNTNQEEVGASRARRRASATALSSILIRLRWCVMESYLEPIQPQQWRRCGAYGTHGGGWVRLRVTAGQQTLYYHHAPQPD